MKRTIYVSSGVSHKVEYMWMKRFALMYIVSGEKDSHNFQLLAPHTNTGLQCLFDICQSTVIFRELIAPCLVIEISPTSQGHQHDGASNQEEEF